MLPNALRDRLRATTDRTKPTSIAIQRSSSTRDSEGDTVTTWPTLATVSGRIGLGDQRAPIEGVSAEELTGQMIWTVALPAGTDVTNKDRLVAGGVTYSVLGVISPMSYEIERRCVCVVVG
jgi:head-tail adaptor